MLFADPATDGHGASGKVMQRQSDSIIKDEWPQSMLGGVAGEVQQLCAERHLEVLDPLLMQKCVPPRACSTSASGVDDLLYLSACSVLVGLTPDGGHLTGGTAGPAGR